MRTLAIALTLLGGAACGSTQSPAAPAPLAPPTPLIAQVSSGGYVIFVRHTARDSAAISTADLALADNAGACVAGSELTPEGNLDALRIGEGFRRFGVRVNTVYSSPACRAKQTSRLAFGEAFDVARELTWPGMWSDEEKASLTPGLLRMLAARPPEGTNTILVSHSDVLQPARVGVTVELGQGDAAVFRPLGGSSFELVGKIARIDWVQ